MNIHAPLVKYHDAVVQGSIEWKELRCGIITASEMKFLITPQKLQVAADEKARKHLYELIGQRITNHVEDKFINDDMVRGQEDEILARDLYSRTHAPVKETGFVTNAKHGVLLGCSPDGLVGDDGLIEVKSRLQKYQIETVIKNEVPIDYMLQIQTALLVTERNWCDFISYCGGLPMYIKRVKTDKKMQDAIIAAAVEIEQKINENIDVFKQNSQPFMPTERIDRVEIMI
jgi:predicted phage-related endonuclease